MKITQILNWISPKKAGLSLLLSIVGLQILGLIALYSAAYGADGTNIFLFNRQIGWILLGWAVFFAIRPLKINVISMTIWPLFLIHFILLILVFFVGKEIYGARRWLDLGLFSYQPSETLKFVLILVAAQQLSLSPLSQVLSFKQLLRLCAFIFPPVALVLFQPDLGTAGIILLITSSLFLFKGIEKKTLISLCAVVFISVPAIWSFLLKPYQKARVSSFIKPGSDPQGAGYNVIQSKIAIGSGRLLGKGFRKGTQNKLQFLPERHTDFIFSVLSEEYGFLGGLLTLALFFYLISFIFKSASLTRDRLSCYICVGSGLFFLWHVILNVAMTVGFFPVVGIPLPLCSYGGSHTVTAMTCLGLVASVYKTKDLF